MTTSRVVRHLALFGLLVTPRKIIDSRWARRALATFAPGASPDMLPNIRLKHCLPPNLSAGFASGFASGLSAARHLLSVGKRKADAGDAGAETSDTKTVALFTGCVGQIADRETLWCGARLLEAAGYTVIAPARQTCCGALHAHNGHATQAQEMIARNRAAFKPFKNIVSCASGCGEFARAHLSQASQSVFDFSDYLETRLAQSDSGARLEFHPLRERVIVHTPCTLRHYFDASKPIALLKRIPEIQLDILPSQGRCCGAAGSNMLDHATTAAKIGREVIAEIDALGRSDGEDGGDRRILVTSNVGCAMHLRRMLKSDHSRIEVLHSATLLWRQLKRENAQTTPRTSR